MPRAGARRSAALRYRCPVRFRREADGRLRHQPRRSLGRVLASAPEACANGPRAHLVWRSAILTRVPEQVPLTTLLSWTWIAFTIEVDNAVEAAGSERVGRLFRISLPMWTNGLRFIDEDGVSVDELRTRAGAGCNIAGLERWGWISVGDGGSERREGFGSQRGVKDDTVLRPTRAGRYARGLWPKMVTRVEDRWRTRFGVDVVDSLGAALLPLAAPMPWSPPEVHPSDGFRTAVIDGGDNTDDGRSLVALLGQVLTSLTIAHERDAEVSLPLAANVLRVIANVSVRTRDLPQRAGVSKEAIAMAISYLRAKSLVAARPDRSVVLTSNGLEALDDYRARAARPKHEALRGALEGILSHGEALSAGLVPPEGCWRSEKPYLTQTKRLLSDLTGALPSHPMVLHRSAWPDGS